MKMLKNCSDVAWLCNGRKATEVYALYGWIAWYVNYLNKAVTPENRKKERRREGERKKENKKKNKRESWLWSRHSSKCPDKKSTLRSAVKGKIQGVERCVEWGRSYGWKNISHCTCVCTCVCPSGRAHKTAGGSSLPQPTLTPFPWPWLNFIAGLLSEGTFPAPSTWDFHSSRDCVLCFCPPLS